MDGLPGLEKVFKEEFTKAEGEGAALSGACSKECTGQGTKEA